MPSDTDDSSATDLPYEPPQPKTYEPNIALVGCGAVAKTHQEGYRDAGFDVVVYCDLVEKRAREQRNEFYPDAEIYTDAADVFERDDIDIIDIATHPKPRMTLMEEAIKAGKRVLTQKPFVLDLDVGRRLVELADEHGVKLAVNQNGRWAPHWAYLRQCVDAGLIGTPIGAHLDVHWNHDWINDTSHNEIEHAILYDFAIHWYDILACIMEEYEPIEVFSSVAHSPIQASDPPLLGQVTVQYENAQASLIFDGNTQYGRSDQTTIVGTEGTIHSEGPSLNDQTVTIENADRIANPTLEGTWFPDGFRGTMGELLCAVEEDREPSNSGRDNLSSLELCFAAIAAAEEGEPKVPGDVERMPGT